MADRQQGYRQDEHNNNASSAEESGYQVRRHNDLHTPPQVLIFLIVGAIILATVGSLFLRSRLGPTQDPELLKNIQSGLSFHLVKDQAMSAIQLEPADPQTELILIQPATKSTSASYFKVNKESALKGANVKRAYIAKDEMGSDVIHLSFDETGAAKLAEVTGENIGMQLAFVFNDMVISAPVIQARIAGGEAQINGRNIALIFEDIKPAEQKR
jgi:preprotein translocase subunit SecD